MREEDIDQVLTIEETSFLSPWSRKSFETELQKEFGISLVVLDDNRIVGYLVEWLVADEIHIANIAVHPDYRQRGIGERLMQEVIRNSGGFSWIRLEVRRSNKAARELYAKLGFREVGVRRNYYVQEGEDAILMVRRLVPEPVV
jgi:ribosomal-protein-alanine N-acetyltransferase